MNAEEAGGFDGEVLPTLPAFVPRLGQRLQLGIAGPDFPYSALAFFFSPHTA